MGGISEKEAKRCLGARFVRDLERGQKPRKPRAAPAAGFLRPPPEPAIPVVPATVGSDRLTGRECQGCGSWYMAAVEVICVVCRRDDEDTFTCEWRVK